MRILTVAAVAAFTASAPAWAAPLSKSECRYLDTHLRKMIEGVSAMAEAAESLDTGPIEQRTSGALLASIREMDAKRAQMVPVIRDFIEASEDMSRQLRRCP
ncbi:MAG TPA: hypothetical protein VEZ24_09420 [Microvirga sp.]|nr:hypothetical protein [Microvirga sp.]